MKGPVAGRVTRKVTNEQGEKLVASHIEKPHCLIIVRYCFASLLSNRTIAISHIMRLASLTQG